MFLDDIFVFGSDFDQTLSNLAEICDRLCEANLTCKPKKCELFRKKIAFLGHIVSDKGMECDPAKTEAVRSWPVPNCVKKV